jgi:large subunit ribosomal protein L32
MACPKKKTSKSKRDKRRANWNHLGSVQAAKAMSMGKSILTGRAQGFYYPVDDEETDEE